jgi:catechol 2,3-dioxygenase-like lactoylglutathione lyase family enzyme
VLALDHAGIHVADLERSIAFYTRVFGLQLETRFEFDAERLAFLATSNGWIELIADGGPPRLTGVVDHVALRVASIEALLPRLRAAGVSLIDQQPVRVPELNARILFCLGPDGERIELIERLP